MNGNFVPAGLALMGLILTSCTQSSNKLDFVGGAPAAKSESLAPAATAKQVETGEDSSQFNTESYDHVDDNPYLAAKDNPLSTFSIDVDTASYSIVRRFLRQDSLPPPGAVRIEELINYFPFDYPPPTADEPFSVSVKMTQCPWKPEHRLVRIGLKGRVISADRRPPANLVFLIDVSGSMEHPNKLPLVKSSMKLLVDQLGADDRVAIVVYAGSSGVVLPSTSGDKKHAIHEGLDRLHAGGSTNGGQGIRLAYNIASERMLKGGTNRVILCTDGDFNVGTTSESELVDLIREQAKSGVCLSVLGFGTGNYKDSTIEKLADEGNGNYAYIDTFREARKVLVEQLSGTLVTIAKDVKIQVDFNPAEVGAYRLIGFENRILPAQDFKDDRKDAGDIGAGHSVTALYEIVPPNMNIDVVEPSKYQQPSELTEAAAQGELLTVRLRYKLPDEEQSQELRVTLPAAALDPIEKVDSDFRFASAVAEFGILLRRSPYRGDATFESALQLATSGLGIDEGGFRREFIELIRCADALRPQ